MLKIDFNLFHYHESGTLKIIVRNGSIRLVIGVPQTRIKDGPDGFNHPDLAKGAIMNFFCWPPQRTLTVGPNQEYEIGPFIAYKIAFMQGDVSIEGDFCGQNKLSMS